MTSLLYSPSTRILTHSTTIPFSPNTTFAALTDIPTYSRATSLIHTSTTVASDHQHLPKKAKFHIGYDPLGITETWTCSVICDKKSGTIEIRREGESSVFAKNFMRWKITGVGAGKTKLELEIEVKLKGAMVDGMFSMTEGYVAQTTVERFVGLVKEREKKEKEEAVRKRKAAAGEAKRPVEVKKSPPPPIAAKRVPKKLEVRLAPPAAAAGKPKASV